MRRTTILILMATSLLAIPAQAVAKTHHATPKPCVIPRVVGDSLTTAHKRINAAHCDVGTVIRPKGAYIASTLKIAAQCPNASKRHRKHGYRVRLTLTAKPKPTTITPVVPPTPTPTSTPTPTPTPTSAPAPQISYKAAVDPSFTQSPSNPLQVTYDYSADASSQTQGAQMVDLGATDQLPDGILNFYNGGQLACSMNVGGATTGGTCTVTYSQTGTYSVTTEYIPTGTSAVTQTEQETIQPYTTSVYLANAIGSVSGNSFPIAFDATVLDPNGDSVVAGTPLTFTITDSTTGNTVESFTEPADRACLVVVSVNPNNTQTFQAAQVAGCNLLSITVPLADTYTVTAAFLGTNDYLSSVSNPGAL